MNFIRQQFSRIVAELRKLEFWLGLAVLFLIVFIITSSNPSRLSWGIYIAPPLYFVALLISPFANENPVIGAAAAIIYLAIIIAVFRFGPRRLSEQANRLLVGDGWAGWAMSWLWILAYLVVVHPIALIFASSASSFNGSSFDPSLTVATPYDFLGLIVGMTIFQIASRKVDVFRWRAALLALGLGILVQILAEPVLNSLSIYAFNWASVFGARIPSEFARISVLIGFIPSYCTMVLLIIAMRIGFVTELKVLTMSLFAGALVSSFLLYPAFTEVYNSFVPEQAYFGAAHESASSFAFIASALVVVLAGAIVVYLIKPRSRFMAFSFAAMTGGLIGMMAYALVASWLVGIAAQSPLYGFVFGRDGYNEAEWVLKLAIGVNNVFPLSMGAFWLLSLIGAGLAGITGLLTPINFELKQVSSSRPQWVLVAIMASPFIQASMMITAIIMNSLDPAIANVFLSYGYVPDWNPVWNTLAINFSHFVFVVSLQLGLILWLNRRFLGADGEAGNKILLNAVCTSAIFSITLGISQLISIPHQWWSVLIAVITTGFGIELLRLSLTIPRQNEPVKNRRSWIASGVFSGFLAVFFNWMMISIALSIVLITVVLIVPLAAPETSQIELSYLLDVLSTSSFVPVGSMTIVLPASMILGAFLSFLLVMDVAGMSLASMLNLLATLRKRLPPVLGSDKGFILLSFVLAFAVDYLIALPVFSCLWGLIYIRPTWLRKVMTGNLHIVLAILFSTIFFFLASYVYVLMTEPKDAIEILIQNAGAAFCAYIAIYFYHIATLYLEREHASNRYLQISLFIAFLSAAVVFALHDEGTAVGGVSRYDGTRWRVFDTETSELGMNLPMDILPRENAEVWVASSSGILSIYDGSEFSSKRLLQSGSPSGRFEINSNTLPFLQETSDGQIFYGSGNSLRLGDASFDPSTGLECLAASTTSSSNFDCYLPELNSAISAVALVDSETIWVGTDYALFLWDGESWQNLTVQIAGDLNRVRVNALALDAENLWIATNLGLFYYDSTSDTIQAVYTEITDNPNARHENYSSNDSTDPHEVYHVYLDHTASVWFANREGLWQVSDQARLVLNREQLTANASSIITSMINDGRGNYWIGTENGLIRYDSLSNSIETFNSAETGLVVDYIRDIELDTDGNLWVASFELEASTFHNRIVLIAFFMIPLLIAGLGGGDYLNSPEHRSKRKAKQIATNSDKLYEQIYRFLGDTPSEDTIRSTAKELDRLGLPSGGAILLQFSQVIHQDKTADALEGLKEIFANGSHQVWAEKLHHQYSMMQEMLAVSHLTDINHLELIVSPSSTGSISIASRKYHIDLLPFTEAHAIEVWQSLSEVCVNLRKYAEVNDTADRLSYLASALAAMEIAQAQSKQVALPERPIFLAITENWRSQIGQAVSNLSGSAELRLELRTRQIKRQEKVTAVLKVENVGRAAAENIRIALILNESETIWKSIDRLSLNRSETLEFEFSPTTETSSRLLFQALWDDRLAKDKSLEYGDEIRFYTDNETFRPISNPYIVGHPVKSSQMFFGREDVFRFIEENLSGSVQNRTIVLYGQRRTGKTSLLYQLQNGRLGEQYIVCLIDMQSLVMLIESTADFLGEILYQLAQRLELSQVAIAVPTIDSTTDNASRVFNRFIDELCRKLENQRLLIIFDEFELIESKIKEGKLDADILSYLRSLIQHRDNLVFIFTGTHRLEEMSHDYWSILFNIALSRKISFLAEADARDLIRQPVETTLKIDDLAVEKIIRLTNGHPFFTQLMAWALVNHCNESKRNYASINDVNDALSLMLKTGETHFSYIWQQANADEQLFMATLAQTDDTWLSPEKISDLLLQHGIDDYGRSQLIDALDSLVQREILDSTTEGSLRYRFKLGVLQRWISISRPLASVIARRSL